MNNVIAVVNQKGGVGKTTTTLNLGTALAAVGKRVLIVDLDPQGNASTGLGINKNNLLGSYELLVDKVSSEEVIYKTVIPNLCLIAANMNLSGAEVELVNLTDREFFLKKRIRTLKSQFDFIFIDCPPSLGLLTINALVAADRVLVPLQCEFYALEGLSQLLNTIDKVAHNFNVRLTLQGIILTMFDTRSSLSSQVAQDVRAHLKDKVYKTYIPRNVRLAEAPSFGKPALIYDLKCQGAQAYLQLASEFLRQQGDKAA